MEALYIVLTIFFALLIIGIICWRIFRNKKNSTEFAYTFKNEKPVDEFLNFLKRERKNKNLKFSFGNHFCVIFNKATKEKRILKTSYAGAAWILKTDKVIKIMKNNLNPLSIKFYDTNETTLNELEEKYNKWANF